MHVDRPFIADRRCVSDHPSPAISQNVSPIIRAICDRDAPECLMLPCKDETCVLKIRGARCLVVVVALLKGLEPFDSNPDRPSNPPPTNCEKMSELELDLGLGCIYRTA